MYTIKFDSRAAVSSAAIAEGMADWAEMSAGRNRRRAERQAEVETLKKEGKWMDAKEAFQVTAERDAGAWPLNYWAAADAVNRIKVARAKRKAAAHGLGRLWWVFMGFKDDPMAVKIARDFLQARNGERNASNHGGWDSYGKYGLCAEDVQDMWRAAGCRDGRKYRMQLAAGVAARKGDSLTWFANYVRGLRWVRKNARHLCLSRNAIAALGRLSWHCRWAALAEVKPDNRPLRIRDLNWQAVRQMQDAVKHGNDKLAASFLGCRGMAEQLGRDCYVEREIVPLLCPSYPTVEMGKARLLARGMRPVDIAQGELTAAEAHAWLMSSGRDLGEWYAGHHQLPRHRSIRVLKWLLALKRAKRWETLTKTRTQFVGGQAVNYTAMDVLDEIQPEDIHTGKDSVTDVLARAAERGGKEYMERNRENLEVLAEIPAWCRKLPTFVRVLNTPAALVAEGEQQSHCVGTYVNVVRSKTSVVLAIQTRHGHTTAEIAYDGSVVRQHRSYKNRAPATRNDVWLTAFMNRLGRAIRKAA